MACGGLICACLPFMSKQFERLGEFIEARYACKATFTDLVPIVEMYGRKVVWEGVVAVFAIRGNSRADRCYAWEHNSNQDTKVITILGMGPIATARDAVRASIVANWKAEKESK
jgi:hypothetical protein